MLCGEMQAYESSVLSERGGSSKAGSCKEKSRKAPEKLKEFEGPDCMEIQEANR